MSSSSATFESEARFVTGVGVVAVVVSLLAPPVASDASARRAETLRALVVGFALGVSVLYALFRVPPRYKVKNKTTEDSSSQNDVSESTIRRMTRLAMKHNAVNLSQGFPNEPPPRHMALHAAGAILAGENVESARDMAMRLASKMPDVASGGKDALNQYSFPYGAPFLRRALSSYYRRWYGTSVDFDAEITICMGATEGFAATLRALTKPGDVVVFFQPFHELYPSQVKLFYLTPRAVTLRPINTTGGSTRRRRQDDFDDFDDDFDEVASSTHEASSSSSSWGFNIAELDGALKGARLFLFNDPHNPSGHVFTDDELAIIGDLCVKHDVTIVTDEIYEHIRFFGGDDDHDDDDDARSAHKKQKKKKHTSLFEKCGRERVVLVNSVSKTAKATGWRIGWIVANAARTAKIRAVHDQLVASCPTPLQFGVAAFLGIDDNDDTHDGYLSKVADDYLAKRDLLLLALRAQKFDVGPVPRGAYYVFADYTNVPALRGKSPEDAATYMTVTVGVACVPGDNFYLTDDDKINIGARYLRFAFVRSLDLIQQAADRLATMTTH